MWNVEDNQFDKCKAAKGEGVGYCSRWDLISIFCVYALVPSVNFQVYAPGFLSRFFESHAVMLQGNSGLKPKEGEVTSRPWQWPINYRVSVGKYLLKL